ncbi:MAG: DUF1801 domain-containing protein [Woeseia sp.]
MALQAAGEGKLAELKTRQTKASVAEFLAAIADPQLRADARKIAALMRAATGSRARMWGTSIVGFGSYHYKYASGREGDWPLLGFSPRKQNLSVYIMAGFSGSQKLLAKLGKHKTGKSCLYIRRLDDIDMAVLRELIDASVRYMRANYTTRK